MTDRSMAVFRKDSFFSLLVVSISISYFTFWEKTVKFVCRFLVPVSSLHVLGFLLFSA